MKNDKQALNLFKTYMVLGPDYQRERGPKPILPKSIVHNIMQYAQYDDWMKTAEDLAALLKRNELNFITQSEAWAQDPSLDNAKKWLSNPNIPRVTESYDFIDKSISPLLNFITKCRLVNVFHETVLMRAAIHGHTEALKALLSMPGIDVNAGHKSGWTALMYASHKGHTEAVKVLLAAPGINVNAKSDLGTTALMRAAAFGHIQALKALLRTPGIDVTAVSKTRKTALMWATDNGQTEAVRLINEHPAQSERSNRYKRTFN